MARGPESASSLEALPRAGLILPLSYVYLIFLSMNAIKWTPKAARQAQKIADVAQRRAVFDEISTLANFLHVQGVKRLVNKGITYRLRVGDWRVMFEFDGMVRVVTIEEVKRRNERTY